jgi:hypothetical protein
MRGSQLTDVSVSQFRTMTPLAPDGAELWRMAQIPGKALDLGSLFPVALSGRHGAFPRFWRSQRRARRFEDCFMLIS